MLFLFTYGFGSIITQRIVSPGMHQLFSRIFSAKSEKQTIVYVNARYFMLHQYPRLPEPYRSWRYWLKPNFQPGSRILIWLFLKDSFGKTSSRKCKKGGSGNPAYTTQQCCEFGSALILPPGYG